MAYLTRPSRAPGFSRANFPLYLNRDHFVIQCFDIVGWAMEPVKTILTHSLTQKLYSQLHTPRHGKTVASSILGSFNKLAPGP